MPFFFQIFCFQQPLRCYRHDLLPSKATVTSPRGPLKTVPWGLSHLIMREKIGQNIFLNGKNAFFFNFFCFQQPLRCCRNDLVTLTVIFKIPCGPLKTVPSGLSHSIMRAEVRQNFSFTGKFTFFFQKLVFPTTH